MCNDKIKQRCTKVLATCTSYEGTIPEFSDLFTEDCVSIEDTTQDLYSLVGDIKDSLNFSTLVFDCLTAPQTINPKNVVQLLINTICAQKELIENMQANITTLQEQVQDLQEQNCP